MELLYRCSNDVVEHAGALAGWRQEYDQLSPGRFSGELCDIRLGALRLFRERLNQATMQYMQLPEGCVTLVLPLCWNAPNWGGIHPEGLNVLPQERCFRSPSPADTDLFCFSLPMQSFEMLLPGKRPLPLPEREVFGFALQANALAEIRSGLRVLFAYALGLDDEGTGTEMTEQSLARHARDYLAALLEAAMPSPLPTAFSAATRRYVVDRCCRLSKENPEAPPTLVELCQRLRISRRMLQYSFQSVTGVAPLHYLRAARLNAVRRALLARPEMRIGDAAAAQGFFHPTYFGREYRRLFGELPSQTRRLAMNR